MRIRAALPVGLVAITTANACKSPGNFASLRGDGVLEVSAETQKANYQLGYGVNGYTGATTSYTCVVSTQPNMPVGEPSTSSPLPDAAPAAAGAAPPAQRRPGANLTDDVAAESAGFVAMAPDLGPEVLRSGIVYGDDLAANSPEGEQWAQMMQADNSLALTAAAAGSGQSGPQGATYYMTFAQDVSSAKNQLTLAANATFASLIDGGALELTSKFDKMFSSDKDYSYLVVDITYRGPAEYISNPAINASQASLVKNIVNATNSPESKLKYDLVQKAWQPFDEECASMYVHGLIHGARLKLVLAYAKDSIKSDVTTNAGANLSTFGKVDLTNVSNFLKSHSALSVAWEGYPSITAIDEKDPVKAIEEWWKAVNQEAKAAAPAVPPTPSSISALPVQWVVLEPYSSVMRYVDGNQTNVAQQYLTRIPRNLFPDPLVPERRKVLENYRSYRVQVKTALDRLNLVSQEYQSTQEYKDSKSKLEDYEKELLIRAKRCTLEPPSKCVENQISPPPSVYLPTPKAPPTAPPIETNEKLVDSMYIPVWSGYDLVSNQARERSYANAAQICRDAGGAYHLPSAKQLKYLMDHPEVRMSGRNFSKDFSFLQWIPSGCVWTNTPVYQKSGRSVETFFNVGDRREYEIYKTSSWNPYENVCYFVCVTP